MHQCMPEFDINRTKSNPERLFDLVKTGDQKAFELLFAIFFARLNDFARRVVGDDVVSQDMVQEVFVKLWEGRDRIESINLEAFLFRSVRNRCLDYLKHQKVELSRMQGITVASRYEELYRIDFIGNEPYVLIEQELELEIEKTIQGLPDRCREVFILSRKHGLKNKEIAEALQISIKNVERHLHRALQSFRRNFSGVLPIPIISLLLKSL